MRPAPEKTSLSFVVAFFTLACTAAAVARERQGPLEWLDRMSRAISTLDYEGTVIRRHDGEAQALKVVHKTIDGVVNERVISQEGKGLEFIRRGNEVHCILPDSRSVLIEQWNDQSTLFSTLPGREAQFGSAYDLSVVREEERVAGRPSVLIAIRPHDSYRFGHRLWLDRETGFPLRTELVGSDGSAIEQLKFADISFDSVKAGEMLEPSVDLDHFTWYSEPQGVETTEIETDWVCADLPTGFRVISTRHERLPGVDAPVTHIVYGDGLATVSVFIAQGKDQSIARRSNVGTSNSFSVQIDGHQVTAIGEVPSETVQRIASSMHRR
ncbi:MAG TPA: MucB/RseB C-terminal domain-containing protein [Woeseiaceae bacterium]|nr:MucB/RseB C-terminal domain-containing protein [Woeseiaceae bacterium]